MKINFMKEEKPSALKVCGMTVISKTISSSIMYPHEVLRTRLQHANRREMKDYDGVVSLVKYMLREHGFKSFFAGWTSNLLKVVPATAINFMTFEKLSYYLKNMNN